MIGCYVVDHREVEDCSWYNITNDTICEAGGIKFLPWCLDSNIVLIDGDSVFFHFTATIPFKCCVTSPA